LFFFLTVTPPSDFYPLSLHDALPILLGPVRPRGGPNGLILRGGFVVAEWGDTHSADMTFSVAKSYLAALAGLALTRGLIKDIDEDRKSTRLNSSHDQISYAVFCLKKK